MHFKRFLRRFMRMIWGWVLVLTLCHREQNETFLELKVIEMKVCLQRWAVGFIQWLWKVIPGFNTPWIPGRVPKLVNYCELLRQRIVGSISMTFIPLPPGVQGLLMQSRCAGCWGFLPGKPQRGTFIPKGELWRIPRAFLSLLVFLCFSAHIW